MRYPNKRGRVYTAQVGIRMEPELKLEIRRLDAVLETDVVEAIRIKIRELVKELKGSERVGSAS